MIILRQRLYTINDVKVLKELHQATNGFRKLPKGIKGLTLRDFYRMDKLSKDIYNGEGVNWEDFRTLATHLGLPETAQHGRHAFEKFANPELIERYRSIRAHKLGLGKELKELQRLKQEHNSLSTSLKEIEEVLRNAKDREEYSKAYHQREVAKKALLDWEKANKKQYNSLQDTLYDKLNPNELAGLNKDIAERAAKKVQESIPEMRGLIANSPRNEGLINKITEDIKSSGINVTTSKEIPGNTALYHPNTNTIEMAEGKNLPIILEHEWGHAKWYERMRRSFGYKPELTENPLYDIPNEAGASLEAYRNMLRRVKQGTATPLDLANSKKLIDSAGKQYYYGSVMGTAAYIPGKLQAVPNSTRINFDQYL